jgi:integrase
LQGLGYKYRHVPHGFRWTASTILNESGWNRDWIERQLAHIEGNTVRAAYNAAEYLEDRTKMMHWYADNLGRLPGEVVY